MSEDTFHKSFPPYRSSIDEEYMSEGQVAHFRDILYDLKQELSDTATHPGEAAIEAAHPALSPKPDTAFDTRERRLVENVDLALSRIDAGEYGYCDYCGLEIGLKRLETRPTIILCIDCKTIEDMRERRVAR